LGREGESHRLTHSSFADWRAPDTSVMRFGILRYHGYDRRRLEDSGVMRVGTLRYRGYDRRLEHD